jgi:hypothetical protein
VISGTYKPRQVQRPAPWLVGEQLEDLTRNVARLGAGVEADETPFRYFADGANVCHDRRHACRQTGSNDRLRGRFQRILEELDRDRRAAQDPRRRSIDVVLDESNPLREAQGGEQLPSPPPASPRKLSDNSQLGVVAARGDFGEGPEQGR